jgi:hypothetical protein
MSVIWLFTPGKKTGTTPRVSSQLIETTSSLAHLRNPWITDSVFMGKMYTAGILSTIIFSYLNLTNREIDYSLKGAELFIAGLIFLPLIFTPFLAYRILLIRNLSTICLNRITKKIYYKAFGKLTIFDWRSIGAGLFRRTEFSGSSFTTSYALAFAPRRADGTLHLKDGLWIDSNEPTEPDIQYVAEVWEYLRHFMDHGPDQLPPPGEPNWWHKPLHAICLTPAEAWRHYAPWRTGEPGEMQGKKNWQLPFWAVLFPYNLSVAICWYFICRIFNVRAASLPPEAFEEAPLQPGNRKRK